MSVGDRWWDPTVPAPADDSGDVSDEELLALLGGTKTNGQFVTLPNGHYVLIDPKSGRIIQDFGVKAAGSNYTPATGGQQLGYQQDMAALAEQQRQFDLTQGERKARGDQQMVLDSELGRGQLDVSRGNLAVNQGNLGVSQGRLSLDQAIQSFKQYTDLANLASNPRNFVQTFFMNRGYTPPPDVGRYGNTTQTAADIVPFSQFLQRQGASQQPAPRQLSPASAYPTGPLSTPPTAAGGGYASPYEGLSGFSKIGAPYRLAPNDPDAAGLMAKYPGMYQMTSPEEAVKYMPPKMYGKGGALKMTAPHAVVNLLTGQVAAIAGEQGPETAYFDGAAIIDPSMEENPYSGFTSNSLPYTVNPTQTVNQNTQNPYSGSDPNNAYAAPGVIDPNAPSSAPAQTWTNADLQAMIEAANTGNVAQPHYGLTPAAPQYPQIQQTAQQAQPLAPLTQSLPLDRTLPPETIPLPEQPNAYQTFLNQQQMGLQQTPGGATPIDLSLGASGQSALPTATNPQNASVPGSSAPTFGAPIPSQMPTYLSGEDFTAQSPVIRGLQQSQALPPFMRRLYAQARGDPTQGTNTVQRTDLPPDLPLISKLAWTQMSPSEQQAFLSIASSLGVTPEDYLALVFGGSPQGPEAQAPVFGSPLRWNSQ